jgi:hypothetical protein
MYWSSFYKKPHFFFRVGKDLGLMAENDSGTFSIWDYVVLVSMLIISAAVGVYYRFTGGRQKTTQVSNYIASECHL